METVTCNLCGGDASRVLYDVADLLLDRPGISARFVQCTQCSLVYQDPRPTLAEMSQHYPEGYEPYTDHADSAANSWLLQKAIQYGNWKRSRFVTRHIQGGRLLDVGCSTGMFLQGMQAAGCWELYGVEINDRVAQIARQRHGLNVRTGTLETAAFPDRYFDAVTLWDVLEHLHDPVGTLEEIGRVLKPGGYVVIRVPNLDSWDASLFGRNWAGLDAPRHLYVFSPTTLARLLNESQFQIVEHSCGIGSYVTFVLSVRFYLKARQVNSRLADLISKVLYHPVSRLATAPLFYISSMSLKGPLLVTTAQRTA